VKLALFLGVRVDLLDGLAEKVMVVTFVLGKPLAGLSGDTGQRREESGGGVSQEGIGSDGTLVGSLGERGVRLGRCDLWRQTLSLRITFFACLCT
jgi:hypothetical protein